MKTNLCIPRLRSGSSNKNKNNNNNLTPAMTLLERFREAVFRLIMLSALSKNNNLPHNQTVNMSTSSRSRSCYYYNSAADPHHSEAVAECIEFIKMKAFNDEYEGDEDDHRHGDIGRESCSSRGSSASDDHCMDANSTELVIPVPVICE